MWMQFGILTSSAGVVVLTLAIVRLSGLSTPHVKNLSRAPHATVITSDTDHQAATGVCEVCERDRVCLHHNGLTVCSDCKTELLD
ncbi:MAG: hypothetical protein A07HR60_02331 [uncultured archaeon A07HR60]|nr:MAG: hypothetical protein A07HR60_02331 [uncultured archaeon A07HR60]